MKKADIIQSIKVIIAALDTCPTRAGLKETPERIYRYLKEFCPKENATPNFTLTTFDNTYGDQLITLINIPFSSLCEHHILPFFGKAHIGYVPDKSILGLSKIPRLLHYLSRRLQLQEGLTRSIVNFFMEEINAKGSIVQIEAQHTCLSCRGVQDTNATLKTIASAGIVHNNALWQNQFFEALSK